MRTTETQDRADLAVEAFDALPAQVAVLDADGTILATNRAWRTFGAANGLAEADHVGTNYLAACEEADDEAARAAGAALRSVLDGDRDVATREYPCHSPDERRWFTMRAMALDEERTLVLHTDITDRKLAERDVEARNERLAAVTEVLSHDLRNPLNVALAHAQGLADRPDGDPDTVGERATTIADQLQRMADIIDDAVVLAGEHDPEALEAVALDRAARRAWSHVDTADATLAVADEATVDADASLLSQLLENLFRNAVDHGGPDVTVTVGSLPEDRGFYVADDGPGIPPEDRERVFEAGYTTNASGGGTGMGMAIVRRVADAHDWAVGVEASDGGGTRIEIRAGGD